MGWIKYVPIWLSFLFVCCRDGQAEVKAGQLWLQHGRQTWELSSSLLPGALSHPQSWNSLWIQDSAKHLYGKPGVPFQVWSLAVPLAQDSNQNRPVNKAASRQSSTVPAGQPPHMTWHTLKNGRKIRKTWEGWKKSETQNTSENKTPLWFIRVNKQKLKTPEESRKHDSNTQTLTRRFQHMSFLLRLFCGFCSHEWWNSAWHLPA